MKILILNVHSALNLGDDAIMQTTLHSLQEAFPGVQITVAANDPDSWCKYPDLDTVSSPARWCARPDLGIWRPYAARMLVQAGLMLVAATCHRLFGRRLYWGSPEQRHLLQAYYEADLVLSCGGGNFYAHRELSFGLIWALLTLGFAVLSGKVVVMLPQSFGPIQGRMQRLLARWTFNGVNLILARESLSAAFLTERLHLKKKVVVVPDMAFGLASIPAPECQVASDRTAPFRIGVTIIDRGAQAPDFDGQEAYEEALARLLTRLHHAQDAQIHLFCQCYGPSRDQDDRAVVRRLHERIEQLGGQAIARSGFIDAREIISAYGDMDLVIGTRMHTGIFALCNRVPVLLIGYQPKARGIMTSFGLERYWCDIASVDADTLYALACELLDRRHEISKQIAAHLFEAQAELQQWVSSIKVIACRASA